MDIKISIEESELDKLKSNMDSFMDNTDIDYAYDEPSKANYTVIRVYRDKLDGTKQYPFVYAPNGNDASDKSAYDVALKNGFCLTINGGTFSTSTKKPLGIIVENGKVVRNVPRTDGRKPLTIDKDGNLGYAEALADANNLVANGIISAVCGFMPIIRDYEPIPSSEWDSTTNYMQNAQRQILGQFGNGDYAIVTCEGRNFQNSDGWTIKEAQTVCKKLGLKFAYNLDGGGSAETMLGKKPFNTIYEGSTGRVVPTFIIFNGRDTFDRDVM